MKFPLPATPQNDKVNGRQIAFFAAFLLPVYKLLETPSLLARFMQSDLLLPALLHYALQAAVLAALLYAASASETPLFERLQQKLGKLSLLFFIPFGLYCILAAALPLFDLEKFVYAVFYDTSPTVFSFATFFLFSAFLCCKGLKTTGRIADLALFLFLIPFIALLFMSVAQADASNLLPIFEKDFGHTMSAFTYTLPHFSDVALLLPLIGSLSYRKNDGKKIMAGYGAGALCTVVFLVVFCGLFSTIAPRTHYAFSKIAQYFPALTTLGRVDLLFVYMLSAVLFFYTAIPLQYAVDCSVRVFPRLRRPWISIVLNLALFFVTLFCNKYYNSIYALFCEALPPVFWAFAYALPLAALFFTGENTAPPQKQKKKKEKTHAQAS